MKKIKLLIILLLFSFSFLLSSKIQAYIFGLKSFDNTIQNIQQIEEKYQIRLPVVGFIFDPR